MDRSKCVRTALAFCMDMSSHAKLVGSDPVNAVRFDVMTTLGFGVDYKTMSAVELGTRVHDEIERLCTS